MKILKHTEGEWEIKPKTESTSIKIIHKEQGFVIASIISIDEAEANAKLMMASKDLLETLIEIRSKLQYEQGMNAISKSGKDWSIELKMTNEAINKATK